MRHPYTAHYEMKKNRKVVFEMYGGKCKNCGSDAVEVHHSDCSKDNHSIENLIPLCKQCHVAVHNELRKLRVSKKNKRSIVEEVDSVIDQAVAKLCSKLQDHSVKKRRLFRYWIAADIRRELKISSWNKVDETNAHLAMDIANRWSRK